MLLIKLLLIRMQACTCAWSALRLQQCTIHRSSSHASWVLQNLNGLTKPEHTTLCKCHTITATVPDPEGLPYNVCSSLIALTQHVEQEQVHIVEQSLVIQEQLG